jgi:hypothetical protein
VSAAFWCRASRRTSASKSALQPARAIRVRRRAAAFVAGKRVAVQRSAQDAIALRRGVLLSGQDAVREHDAGEGGRENRIAGAVDECQAVTLELASSGVAGWALVPRERRPERVRGPALPWLAKRFSTTGN